MLPIPIAIHSDQSIAHIAEDAKNRPGLREPLNPGKHPSRRPRRRRAAGPEAE